MLLEFFCSVFLGFVVFRVQGFRVWGSEFRISFALVQGLGLLGFKLFRVCGF